MVEPYKNPLTRREFIETIETTRTHRENPANAMQAVGELLDGEQTLFSFVLGSKERHQVLRVGERKGLERKNMEERNRRIQAQFVKVFGCHERSLRSTTCVLHCLFCQRRYLELA